MELGSWDVQNLNSIQPLVIRISYFAIFRSWNQNSLTFVIPTKWGWPVLTVGVIIGLACRLEYVRP